MKDRNHIHLEKGKTIVHKPIWPAIRANADTQIASVYFQNLKFCSSVYRVSARLLHLHFIVDKLHNGNALVILVIKFV